MASPIEEVGFLANVNAILIARLFVVLHEKRVWTYQESISYLEHQVSLFRTAGGKDSILLHLQTLIDFLRLQAGGQTPKPELHIVKDDEDET
jgi:hypothetical protein